MHVHTLLAYFSNFSPILTKVSIPFFHIGNRYKNKAKRTRRLWSQKWLLRRDSGLGYAFMVMDELTLEDPKAFHNFTRMTYSTCSELLNKVSPLISKQNTEMREARQGSYNFLFI